MASGTAEPKKKNALTLTANGFAAKNARAASASPKGVTNDGPRRSRTAEPILATNSRV